MCGIVGKQYFTVSRKQVENRLLTQMCAAIQHRGPDDDGVWISSNEAIGLGHKRLSILDLSQEASQPMHSSDKSVSVVFNGEIYNYLELKKELVTLGYGDWKTKNSDTEIVIYSYIEWGINCLEKFRGDFAIAIWDERIKELWLARDRAGVKPLYYYIDNLTVSFASEIKALLLDGDIKRQINERAFYNYLSFISTPAPDTMFKNIKKLPNGHYLNIKNDGEHYVKQYWDVYDNIAPIGGKSEKELCEIIRNSLQESVNYRQISDVPVGVLLSGGIDSSINSVLFAKTTSNIKTFTVGYENQYEHYANETPFARLIAEQVKSKHFEVFLNSDDLINHIQEFVYLLDEPIGDFTCFPAYYVSKLAKENGVSVAQAGEGADELFYGYPDWFRFNELEKKFNSSFYPYFNGILLQGLKILNKQNTYRYKILDRINKKQSVFWSGAEAFTEDTKNLILSSRMKEKFKDYSSWDVIEPIYNKYQSSAWEKNIFTWMTYADLNFRIPELLLMRADKMAMAHGLELRVPFLDHKFIETIVSIPFSSKIKNNELKYLLKKTFQNELPAEILNRKKQGFGFPIQDWFTNEINTYAKDKIADFIKETDLLNYYEVEKIIDNPRNAKLFWYLLNLALWWEKFIK